MSCLVFGALTESACTATDSTLPEDFLGRWDYLGSSGGLVDDGLGDEATGFRSVSGDTISLPESVCDGFSHTYERTR